MNDVLQAFRRDPAGTHWVDILFKDYPGWDRNETAPKKLYILFHVLQDSPAHRDFVLEKAVRNGHQKNTIKQDDFYAQFTLSELRAVGI